MPQFYKEMFIYWQEIVEHLGVDELIVWNNKNIKIANKTIFIEELYQHNVVYIHDFFKNRIILPYENFCNIYQIRISRKLYLKVTKAIQKFVSRDQHIQAILDQAKPTHIRNKTRFRLLSGTWIDLRTAKSKHFYNEFLIFKTGFASALTQWQENYNITEETFYSSLPRTINATNETQLIAFQFKILHNIVNNNANLKRWNIQESDECTFCTGHNTDDVVHEFAACSWTREKITEIAREIGLSNTFRQITKTEFIFGQEDATLNNIILIIKHILHNVRQKQIPFHMNVFKAELYKRIISDERTLTSFKFMKKWAHYRDLVREAHSYLTTFSS